MKKFLKASLALASVLVVGFSNAICVSAEELKSITVSTLGTSLPWSFIKEDGAEWEGVDGEIWKEIEKRTGITIDIIRSGSFDATLGNLASGRAQVASNHFAITPERLKTYDCSKPYSTDIGVVATNEDNKDLKTLADFKGKKIAVVSGQSAEVIIREKADEYGYEVISYENTDPGLKDLMNKKVDGFASSQTDLADYMAKTNTNFNIIDEHLDEQPIVFLISKQAENAAEIKDVLNKTIDEMLEDGTIASITKKWFGDDMTQYIDSAVKVYNEANNADISQGS
ncbi:substrate-binding periplasmic protein [Facklamia hominis]|uniref:substrate-binding periplasmic protein n=1 Tax=Facklamia hominis TaxID=178214 RepID=UPI00101C0F9B|nr:transporter substrate-binding domain-containing protein [Facklamia hominis]RYC97640.1 transporter substrate-binding domain-containing protein [Facklamia hominis]